MLIALLSLFATSAAALDASTCPSTWSKNVDTCIWPKQQSYKNVSVASAADPAAACCALCAGSGGKCVEWLLLEETHFGFAAKTCILNDAAVHGGPTDYTKCVSGAAPKPHPPTPTPTPAPAGAKNVLFFAVDDLRPELNAFGSTPIPGTVSPPLHTPFFDALAAKSLVLTKNYVQQAVCSPTRQSLLTGRRPDRTRV